MFKLPDQTDAVTAAACASPFSCSFQLIVPQCSIAIVMAFGLASLGPHRVLQLSSAGLILVLIPGRLRACSIFAV